MIPPRRHLWVLCGAREMASTRLSIRVRSGARPAPDDSACRTFPPPTPPAPNSTSPRPSTPAGAAPLSTMIATALDDARAAPLYGNDQLDVP